MARKQVTSIRVNKKKHTVGKSRVVHIFVDENMVAEVYRNNGTIDKYENVEIIDNTVTSASMFGYHSHRKAY